MRIAKSIHLKRLLQVQDALLGLLVYLVCVRCLHWAGWFDQNNVDWLVGFSPLVLIFSSYASVYGFIGLHSTTWLQQGISVARFVAIAVGGLVACAFVAKLPYIGRVLMAAYAIGLTVVLVANRTFLSWWYLHGRKEREYNYSKLLLIGSGNRALRLIEQYAQHSEWGVKVVGMLDPEPGKVGSSTAAIPVLGTVNDIHSVLSQEVVDEVIVCLPRRMLGNMQSVVDACQEQAVCLKYMADFYDMDTDRVSLEFVGQQPLLRFDPVAMDENKLVLKRIFDLLLAVGSLPFLLPFFALVALVIRLDSPGPVFFFQERVGLNKRIFRMIKFRSMVQNAEEIMASLEDRNEADGPIFKMKHDPRVTRIGRFLRKYSIDELPQIFNVLLGHMSIVGPRPMSVRDVSLFSKGVQRRRFSVRPGLLCLREVSGRSDLSFDRWLELDLQYIDEWSLWLDLKIILKAIPVVLSGSGAS